MKKETKDECSTALQTKTGEFVVKYLEGRLEEVRRDLVTIIEPAYIYRLQGRVFELEELLKLSKQD